MQGRPLGLGKVGAAGALPWLKRKQGPCRGVLGSMLPRLEVHRAVGQVILAANVADLLGLHRLQLGAVSDAMAQAAAEGAAPLACNGRDKVRGSRAMPGQRPPAPEAEGLRQCLPLWLQRGQAAIAPRQVGTSLEAGGPVCSPGSSTALREVPVPAQGLLPPMSSMVSSPQCSTWSTGGTFCFASRSRAFRSISTDSSGGGRDMDQTQPE